MTNIFDVLLSQQEAIDKKGFEKNENLIFFRVGSNISHSSKLFSSFFPQAFDTVVFSSCQDVFLERELLIHQGCIRHEGQQDDRVDGPCRDGHSEGNHKFIFRRKEDGFKMVSIYHPDFSPILKLSMARSGDGDEGVHERGVQARARQLPLPHQGGLVG